MTPRLLAPSRPDWRWARVVELAQFSNSQASARLQYEDAQTRMAFAFKRALDRGTPDDYEYEFAAHYIHVACPRERYLIEGMLLGGESRDEEICSFIGQTEPRIVATYHDLFFAVRPFLKSPGWIASVVFDGMPYKVHPGDGRGLAMRLAWLVGADLFRELVSGQVGSPSRAKCNEIIVGVLQPHVLEMALTVSARSEPSELLRAFSDYLNKSGATETGGGSGDFDKAVGDLFEGFGISVANPTVTSNLTLPAREPRALAYEVASNE